MDFAVLASKLAAYFGILTTMSTLVWTVTEALGSCYFPNINKKHIVLLVGPLTCIILSVIGFLTFDLTTWRGWTGSLVTGLFSASAAMVQNVGMAKIGLQIPKVGEVDEQTPSITKVASPVDKI